LRRERGSSLLISSNAGFGKYAAVGLRKWSIVASAFFGSLSGSIFLQHRRAPGRSLFNYEKGRLPGPLRRRDRGLRLDCGVGDAAVMGALAFVMAITIGWNYATVMIAADPAVGACSTLV